jgi:excisionase family DNA binding protein
MNAVAEAEPRPAVVSPLLTTYEACAYLRCARSTLDKRFRRKQIKRTKLGRSVMWRRSELDSYLDRNTKGPAK